ncbi:MAG: heat-shock protein Hsp20 [Helicobacteraceae bacterium 4484_230]|nr:MAG: heat-shock protein Hsp20 [Helicobacteraceae bacterium 4484_230]
MSKIAKEVQKVEKKIEEGVVETAQKAKEALANVASHLPFANLSHNKAKEAFTIEVDLPGVKKEDISVNIEGDYLNVTGTRFMKEETKKEDYYLLESAYGKFARSFYLPEDIDRDSIDAQYKDGRLTLSFEKIAAKKRREVSVK